MRAWIINADPLPGTPADMAAEAVLNAAKDAAEATPGGAAWRAIGAADAYARAPLKRDFGAQIATNAWIKMWQLLKHYRMLAALPAPAPAAGAPPVLTAFFNAELPGAFVAATNHACAQAGVVLDWAAASYLPATSDTSEEASHILDDKNGLLRGNPGRWLVNRRAADAEGHDGDLRRPAEVERLAAEVQRRYDGGVALYTSDGGVDASSNYNDQERLNARLHLGQALAGLLSLRRGGVMVVKQYTLFRAQNATLAALLAPCFKVLEVAKPHASRPGNSECYLVGLNFRGRDAAPVAAALAALRARLADPADRADEPLPGAPAGELARVGAATAALARHQAGVLADAATGMLRPATVAQKRAAIAALGVEPLPRPARLHLRR